jgi:Flp pilus assembly protein TadG
MTSAFLCRLHGDDRGSVAAIVAVMIVVLTITVGLAIDIGRIFLAQDRLSHAVDDAGLATAAAAFGYTAGEGSCSDTYLTNIAAKFVAANFNASLGPYQNLIVCESTDGSTVAVSAKVKVQTTFMAIIGYNQVFASVNSEIKSSASGLEVVLVLDNTGSMSGSMSSCVRSTPQANGTSYNGTAFGCLLNASYQLVNSLFSAGSGTTAVATPPASLSTLFVGLVPFTNVVNPLNNTATTLNGATLAQYNQILGNDWKVTVGQVVNITAGNFSTGGLPLCAYNGTWTPASNDYVQSMDLVHLAQDICSLYLSSSINVTTGTESFASGAPNLSNFYLADWLNTASSTITGTAGVGSGYSGFAWRGCVEERASKGDPASTPYYDYNVAAGWTYAEYDHGFDYNGITSGTTPTPDYLWHIWRSPGRNPNYLAGPGLPHSAAFKSSWYNGTPTTAIYSQNGYYYRITNYNYPNPFYSVISVIPSFLYQ